MLEPVRRDPRPNDMTVTAFRDGQVTLRSNRRVDGFTESVKEIGYQGVRRGEVVIHSMDAFAGAIGVSDSDGKMSPVVHIYTAPSDNPEFIVHSLRAASRAGFIRALAKGIRERSTSFDRPVLKSMALPRPPRDTQDAIVAYLDRETQKIDELITEQRSLIQTLRERRRSLVTRAVTLGIDGVDLKEAEDRTIGEVPIGWEIRPLKGWMKSLDDVRIPLSATERAERSGVYDYYGASGVIDHVDDYLFNEPLVLVSEDGANLLVRSTPIAFVASGKYWVNNHAHVFRPEDGEVRFWSERIEAVDVTPFVTGSAQPKLTAGALGRIRLSAPADPAERRRISDYIDEQTSCIDELVSESEDLIALSQERRAALITAAVTGQIDVRRPS